MNLELFLLYDADASETTITGVVTVTYPEIGYCSYSAIYQSVFRGAKLIKRFLTSSPKQCFYGCYFEGCRSANLIQIDNEINSCELFSLIQALCSDALIDYRTATVLEYDSGSVYFDGIKCKKKRHNQKVQDSNNSNDDDDDDDDDNEQTISNNTNNASK
ncbi:unnamed protein product [Thelazia callipaeda]|uniref:Apple domain-containing protein n=1 Tax=Thelazia callipaeda TaxID=103827 RepID=A0A0N5CN78_THECL|nr:unnamed protein product [Thelazia callipaeda]